MLFLTQEKFCFFFHLAFKCSKNVVKNRKIRSVSNFFFKNTRDFQFIAKEFEKLMIKGLLNLNLVY
jgi:hypothetical protein